MFSKSFIHLKKVNESGVPETKAKKNNADTEKKDPVYFAQTENFFYSGWLSCGFDPSGIWFL